MTQQEWRHTEENATSLGVGTKCSHKSTRLQEMTVDRREAVRGVPVSPRSCMTSWTAALTWNLLKMFLQEVLLSL